MGKILFKHGYKSLEFEGFDFENEMTVNLTHDDCIEIYLSIEETRSLAEYLNKALESVSNIK